LFSTSRFSVRTSSWTGAAFGGGGTGVSLGFSDVTGGRASSVVVGGFFLHAGAARRIATARASRVSVVDLLFILHSLVEETGQATDRLRGRLNIAKSL
jgi:hypothetical protein